MIIISIISVGLLIVVIGTDTDNNALAKKYKKTKTLAQLNNCGNQLLPTNITCANYNSDLEGRENYVFSFLGMAPADDPELMMYVSVKQPTLVFDTGIEYQGRLFYRNIHH